MIERIELRIIKLPLVEYFETSFGRVYDREILLLFMYSDDIIAYGEAVTDKDPLYSYEDNKTALHVIEDYLIPLVMQRKIEGPDEFKLTSAFIKGHRMAKSAIELALWDLKAKKLHQPLYKLWGGVRNEVISGVSIGMKDSIAELIEIINKRILEGYKRIKLKIKPGKDIQIIEKVRERFPDIALTVDGNSAYRYEHVNVLKQLDAFDLVMIEQPFAHDDIFFHALLQQEINTPICLDETITDLSRAQEAIGLRSCKVINIKIGRVGGYGEAKAIHDYCKEYHMPVWCGGMLESGIGRAYNVAIATLPNFIMPNDISETKRYWSKDIIDYEFKLKDGYISVPEGIGIGVMPDWGFIEKLSIYKRTITSTSH